MKDLNATQAAIRSGYSKKNADKIGSELLGKTGVASRIEKLKGKQAQRIEVNADDILKELMRLGYSDIRGIYNDDGTIKHPKEWPEDIARAVASIEVEELFEGHGQDRTWVGYTKKVKFWPKDKSLDLLGKHKTLFTEKIEHTGKVTLEDLVVGPNKEDK